jgi:hypothetical protein
VLRIGLIIACLAAGSPTTSPNDPREPVPDLASRAQSAKLIAELYQSDLARIKEPGQEADYAARLLKAGDTTIDDPSGRFELLDEARIAAAQAGDAGTALQAVSRISKEYKVDGLSLAGNTLGLVVNRVLPRDAAKVLPVIDDFVGQAVDADRLDLAKLGADMADNAARKSKDGTLIAQAQDLSEEIGSLKAAFTGVPAASAKLAQDPADPDANYIVGHYYAILKGQWGALVPLSRGSDPVLKGIAARDLAGADNAREMADVGDGWWNWAETQAGLPRENARQRAGFWYRKAAPQLKGLPKLVVDHRLFEMQPEHPTTEPSQ